MNVDGNNVNHNNNYRFETGIGPVTDRVLSSVLSTLNRNDFRTLVTDKIMDPITNAVNEKIKPYVYTSIIMYLILLVLLIYAIILLKKK